MRRHHNSNMSSFQFLSVACISSPTELVLVGPELTQCAGDHISPGDVVLVCNTIMVRRDLPRPLIEGNTAQVSGVQSRNAHFRDPWFNPSRLMHHPSKSKHLEHDIPEKAETGRSFKSSAYLHCTRSIGNITCEFGKAKSRRTAGPPVYIYIYDRLKTLLEGVEILANPKTP